MLLKNDIKIVFKAKQCWCSNLGWLSLGMEWKQGYAPKCAFGRQVFWSSPSISLCLGVLLNSVLLNPFFWPCAFFRDLLPKLGCTWNFEKRYVLLFGILWLYLRFLISALQLLVESSQVWNTHWPIYLCPCWLLAVWLARQISSVIPVVCFIYSMQLFSLVLK